VNPPEVDVLATGEALAAQFPDAGVRGPYSLLGAGFTSIVVEANSESGPLVFRIARIPEVSEGFERLRALLSAIAPRLPVAVPQPRWIAEPCERFEHGVMGYPKVPGHVMSRALFRAADQPALAGDFARVIAALHAVPQELTPMLEVRPPEARMTLEYQVRDEVLPVLRREGLSDEEMARVETWWETYLMDPDMLSYEPHVTHGDLWWENVLVDESGSRITGVLDWELAAIADPARDFGGIAYLGYDFLDAVLDAYAVVTGRPDDGLRHRARRVFEVREFYGVRHAARHPAQREMSDAVAKVRRLIGAG
jgi:aminoglycoside phosphotransferase (APT) family kinase protein